MWGVYKDIPKLGGHDHTCIKINQNLKGVCEGTPKFGGGIGGGGGIYNPVLSLYKNMFTSV